MATQPQYAGTPKIGVATISTANTARDGTGTISTVFTAGTSGSRVDRIVIESTGTTTAGIVRLFIHNGTTAYLWKEVPVTAITPSGSAVAFASSLSNSNASDILPLVLPTGYSLRAAPNNAESFNVIAQGGDF